MSLCSIQAVRRVVKDKQWETVQFLGTPTELRIDVFTASAILAAYDASNDDNKAKIERMLSASPIQFQKVATLALKHCR